MPYWKVEVPSDMEKIVNEVEKALIEASEQDDDIGKAFVDAGDTLAMMADILRRVHEHGDTVSPDTLKLWGFYQRGAYTLLVEAGHS